MRHLVDAWLRTAARVNARDDVAGAGADLIARYAEPARRYHDLRHLDEVLRGVDELADHASEPDAVRLAAWFHDAVYDVTADDNEARSAALAETVLGRLRVDPLLVGEVARLVRLTAGHVVADGDLNGAVLCDADLAVLAGDAGRYSTYVDAVREEYAHVPDDAFRAGRAAVLRGLLALDPLFRTPSGRAAWEAAARANVTAELARLEH